VEGWPEWEIWSRRRPERNTNEMIGFCWVYKGVCGGAARMGNLVQEAPRAKYQRNDWFLIGFQRVCEGGARMGDMVEKAPRVSPFQA